MNFLRTQKQFFHIYDKLFSVNVLKYILAYQSVIILHVNFIKILFKSHKMPLTMLLGGYLKKKPVQIPGFVAVIIPETLRPNNRRKATIALF